MPTLTARRVPTARLTQHILEDASRDAGEPVVFVHGNVSCSAFWQDAMLALPERYRPIAVDLRGFGGTDPLPVDATRGLRDYADDLMALLEALHMERAHFVGWSMGGGVVLQHMRDRPAMVRSLTLVNPVSPYGFGGTKGVDGRLNSPDGAGSGGGTANPDFVRLLAEKVAAGIVRDAQERADALIEEAEERTQRLVADAEERLSQIRIEREAVAGYFENLRGMLQQADKVSADD